MRGLMRHRIRCLFRCKCREKELLEVVMAFADSMAKLQADVAKLIAENGPSAVATAVAAAVAAKDAADAAAVDALDVSVVASLAPPAAPTA